MSRLQWFELRLTQKVEASAVARVALTETLGSGRFYSDRDGRENEQVQARPDLSRPAFSLVSVEESSGKKLTNQNSLRKTFPYMESPSPEPSPKATTQQRHGNSSFQRLGPIITDVAHPHPLYRAQRLYVSGTLVRSTYDCAMFRE